MHVLDKWARDVLRDTTFDSSRHVGSSFGGNFASPCRFVKVVCQTGLVGLRALWQFKEQNIKMTTYKVVMIRHGESEWNKANKFCGWFDADLSELGVQEAKNSGKVCFYFLI